MEFQEVKLFHLALQLAFWKMALGVTGALSVCFFPTQKKIHFCDAEENANLCLLESWGVVGGTN